MLYLLLSIIVFTESLKNVNSSPIKVTDKDNAATAVQDMAENPETMEEQESQTYGIAEGDVMLSDDRNAVESRWPTQMIPYVISFKLASRTDDILKAMAMVSDNTCVSFHKRTFETNYLFFKKSRGCASYVGFRGGKQLLLIGPTCKVGNIVHEILHALGFHHEHTREDRERHISILSQNIIQGKETNFQKKPGNTYQIPYDLSSIMHYGGRFFSRNGLPTIVSHEEVKNMGQRVKMTKSDIERVEQLYKCGSKTRVHGYPQ